MTIANIEDVMDRIMSLNRNLNEESLKTLLSASGWDKEDIVEGIRIFKNKGGIVKPISPIGNAFANQPVQQPAPEPKIENNYSFNIKKEEPKVEEPIKPVEIPKAPEIKVEEKKEVPVEKEEVEDDKQKKTGAAKIFSVVLILVLVGMAIAYILSTSFGKYIDSFLKKNIKAPSSEKVENVASTSQVSIAPPIQTAASSTLDSILQEISNLKNELNNYKQSANETKTIVKYISQRGATGKAGRGISSISSTSTGFVINYTDGGSTIIPYSTTTIVNILNSSSVCFRDIASSTDQATNDICLDRNTVSKLIASSTSSQ